MTLCSCAGRKREDSIEGAWWNYFCDFGYLKAWNVKRDCSNSCFFRFSKSQRSVSSKIQRLLKILRRCKSKQTEHVWQAATVSRASSWSSCLSNAARLSSTRSRLSSGTTRLWLPTRPDRVFSTASVWGTSGNAHRNDHCGYSATYNCCCRGCTVWWIACVNGLSLLQRHHSHCRQLHSRYIGLVGLWWIDFSWLWGGMLFDSILCWWSSGCCSLVPKLPEATWRVSSNVKRHGRGDGIDTTKREVREMCSLNFILTALSSPFVQYRPLTVDKQEVKK